MSAITDGPEFMCARPNRSWIVEGVAGVVFRNYLLLTTRWLATAGHTHPLPFDNNVFVATNRRESSAYIVIY